MDLFNKQTIKELKEKNRHLKEEVEVFHKKEHTWVKQNVKLSRGVGNFLNEDYLYNLIDYIFENRTQKLLLVTTVRSTKELDCDLDEMMSGFWYGVIVYDQEKIVMEIPTLIEGDGCFVSEVASKRREKNRYLMNALAEYLRMGLVNERSLERLLKEVEVKEELKVGETLFL